VDASASRRSFGSTRAVASTRRGHAASPKTHRTRRSTHSYRAMAQELADTQATALKHVFDRRVNVRGSEQEARTVRTHSPVLDHSWWLRGEPSGAGCIPQRPPPCACCGQRWMPGHDRPAHPPAPTPRTLRVGCIQHPSPPRLTVPAHTLELVSRCMQAVNGFAEMRPSAQRDRPATHR
jgi:hypothetical protein